jgi:hypothetical protein
MLDRIDDRFFGRHVHLKKFAPIPALFDQSAHQFLDRVLPLIGAAGNDTIQSPWFRIEIDGKLRFMGLVLRIER